MSPARAEARPVAIVVGFMGAGKSSVGRVVADLLGVDFRDSDLELETRAGRDIPEIFRTEGVDGFRSLERDVIVDAVTGFDGVVSLGGGAVTTTEVREVLRGLRVVYLRIDPRQGYARVQGTDRPLLAVDDPETRYRELHDERAALYEQVATITIDAGSGDADEVADAVIACLADELAAQRKV
ncbi:shikimate kinase [Gordonia soli]|uniref:Shikimate kinase n=1 Tax=Gordonia soli NBRC 108243 TaxID=1223545 RepID=M0QKK4_9ACTN|nr:shikimate kinase [Gordonia soli]GAC68806.1 shikimate kinase [Gordonia soli NBRC 108243]